MEHTLERALVLSRGGVIRPEHLTVTPATSAMELFDNVPLEIGLHEAVMRLERRLIERALEISTGNRRLLYDRMREFGME